MVLQARLELLLSDFASALKPHPLAGGITANFLMRKIGCDPGRADNSSKDKPSEVTFLVYGRTGWIGGMLGKLLKEGRYKYYFGSARLHDRWAVEEDIRRSRPTHILNAVQFNR